MTKEEFLPTLSQKAQDIVIEYLNSFHNKGFQVFYSNDMSKVVSEDNADYIIYVKNDVVEDVEYRFLHEFFHCVQYELGFPHLKFVNSKYEDLANSISSLILDLDVRERLEYYGYFEDLKYIRESVKLSEKLMKMIQMINDKKEMMSLDDIIGLAGILLTSDIAKIDNSRLAILVRKMRPKAFHHYNVLSDCVKRYSYKNADEITELFILLLEKFELSSFIQVEEKK